MVTRAKKEIADALVAQADANRVGRREPGFTDNKCMLFSPMDLDALLSSGADMLVLNRPSSTGCYIQEVRYRGVHFICATRQQINMTQYPQ